MEINLTQDSIVDERTGAVSTPTEFLMNLREIEVNIARCDEEIGALKADLKRVRDRRETLVTQLRAAVREGKVLPLLELHDAPVAGLDDGLDIEDD